MIVTDLSNSFNPVPKEKRIKNKKLLQDKKTEYVKYVVKEDKQKNTI